MGRVSTRTDKKTSVKPDYSNYLYYVTGSSNRMKLMRTPRKGGRGTKKSVASLGSMKRDPKRMYFATKVKGKLAVKSFKRKNA